MMIDNITFNSNGTNYSDLALFANTLPFTVCFCLQFLFSVIGNSLIIRIVLKDNRLRTTTNFLAVNMAVSDLLSAFVVLPRDMVWLNVETRWLIGGDFGNVLCKFHAFIIDTTFVVSLYSCVSIAIDRYYAVAHPMKVNFHGGKIKYIIAGIWILSGLLASPEWYFFSVFEYDNQIYCSIPQKIRPNYMIFYLSTSVLTFGLAAPFVTILYVLIVYKLYQHKMPGQQTDSALRRREQQNRKVVKMAITIVALLYLSWGFWNILFFLEYAGNLSHVGQLAKFNLQNIAQFILNMSLIYNFFLYLIFNEIYRENIKTMITKCCFTCPLNQPIRNNEVAVALEAVGGMNEVHDIA